MSNNSQKCLRALPVQLVRLNVDTVLLTRGTLAVKFVGSGILEALRIILTEAEARPMTKEGFLQLFSSVHEETVAQLIDHLTETRVLVPDDGTGPAGETPTDVFYWDVGLVRHQLSNFESIHLGIVGVNETSLQITQAIGQAGVKPVVLLDDPSLRNLSVFGSKAFKQMVLKEDATADLNVTALSGWNDWTKVNLMVACSDFGAAPILRRWNQICVEHGVALYPVLLDSIRATVGPLVIPGQTACLECVNARERGALEVEHGTLAELNIFKGQNRGFHPTMAKLVASLASLELLRIYGLRDPVGLARLHHVNFLSCEMTSHPVLKIPRCSVCGTKSKGGTISITRDPDFQ